MQSFSDTDIRRISDYPLKLLESFKTRHRATVDFIGKYFIYILIVIFGFLYSFISINKHMRFESNGWDLGIFDQHLWQLSNFEFGYNTVRLVPSLFGDHFHPIFLFLTPLYWIWEDVRILLIFQAIVMAATALPLFLIVRDCMRSRYYALALSGAYLISWGVLELVFFDFHPICVLPLLFAWAYYFIVREKWSLYYLMIPLLLITKENTALMVLFLGIYLIIFRKKYFEGAVTCIVSSVWFFAVCYIIMPGIVGNLYYYTKYYTHLGDSFSEMAWSLVSRPLYTIEMLFYPLQKTVLLFFIFAPFLFIPFFSGFSIIAIPPLLERLFSNESEHWRLLRHYNAIYSVIFVIATVEGLPRLYALIRRARPNLNYRKLALYSLTTILIIQIPFSLATSSRVLFSPSFYRSLDFNRVGHEIVKSIPPDASVTAQCLAVPHLTHREFIFQFDGNTYGSAYVILNPIREAYPLLYDHDMEAEIEKLRRDPRYIARDYPNDWVVFEIKPEYAIYPDRNALR